MTLHMTLIIFARNTDQTNSYANYQQFACLTLLVNAFLKGWAIQNKQASGLVLHL